MLSSAGDIEQCSMEGSTLALHYGRPQVAQCGGLCPYSAGNPK